MTGCRRLTRHRETRPKETRFHSYSTTVCVTRFLSRASSPSLSTFNWWTSHRHHDHHRSSLLLPPDSLIFSRCPGRISEFDRAVCHRADSLHGTAEWTVVYVHAPSNITDYDASSLPCRCSPLPPLSTRAPKEGYEAVRSRVADSAVLLTSDGNGRRKRALCVPTPTQALLRRVKWPV